MARRGAALGEHPNALRYAAPTGTVVIRWDGARQPTVWTVPPPEVDPREARLELARRYLHVFGPTTPEAFARWAGIAPRRGVAAFDALGRSLTPVRTPIGDAWILTRDEPTFRAAPGPRRPHGSSRAATPTSSSRETIASSWSPTPIVAASSGPSRVWPGGLLVEGEIVGTWRRAQGTVTVRTWRRLSRAARDAVEAEAASLPLPGVQGGSSSAGTVDATGSWLAPRRGSSACWWETPARNRLHPFVRAVSVRVSEEA